MRQLNSSYDLHAFEYTIIANKTSATHAMVESTPLYYSIRACYLFECIDDGRGDEEDGVNASV